MQNKTVMLVFYLGSENSNVRHKTKTHFEFLSILFRNEVKKLGKVVLPRIGILLSHGGNSFLSRLISILFEFKQNGWIDGR